MRKATLAGATAVGMVLGAVLVNAPATLGQTPVIDVAAIVQAVQSVAKETGILDVLTAMQTVQNTISSGISDFNKALGVNTYGDTNTLLRQGFTQNANYSKAEIGAQQQITDASNASMARFTRDVRNAQIRDEQTPSPTACSAIDGGVSTQAAAIQAYAVGQVLSRVHDLRGEAAPGMPSHFGQAQGVASMSQEHANYYCNADDAAANLCTLSPTPDADQQMLSLFGSGTYANQTAVTTAKDFAINLIEPVAPAAIRGDQLSSSAGQDAAVRRRSFNARMSLAQGFVDQTIGMQTPSVPLTAIQRKYLQNMGLPAQTTGSWLQVLQIEAERRVSDLTWNASLQSMPPASVQREVASEMALANYLAYQNFKMNLLHSTIGAASLAAETDRDFKPTVQMPTPTLTAN